MRLEHPYWVWKSHFSKDFCEKVIAQAGRQELKAGTVFRDPAKISRKSQVTWFGNNPDYDWIRNPVTQCMRVTNQRFWRFSITETEPIQFTQYFPGDFYEWHMDQRVQAYGPDSRWPGLIRKLSMTVTLSDAHSYSGGDFMLEDLSKPPDKAGRRIKTLTDARPQGSVVVFASSLYHRVSEVTSGTRYSLVTWFLGPPYV